MPALAATSAMPDPMIPDPTMPSLRDCHGRRRYRWVTTGVQTAGRVACRPCPGPSPWSVAPSGAPAATSTASSSSASGGRRGARAAHRGGLRAPRPHRRGGRALVRRARRHGPPAPRAHPAATPSTRPTPRPIGDAALHLPVRGQPDAPALGAQGLAGVGRPRRGLAGRRGAGRVRLRRAWCSATRWSTPAAVRSPSASGLIAPMAVIPHHDTWSEDKAKRTLHIAPDGPAHRRRRRAHGPAPRARRRLAHGRCRRRSSSSSTAPRPTSPPCPDRANGPFGPWTDAGRNGTMWPDRAPSEQAVSMAQPSKAGRWALDGTSRSCRPARSCRTR